LWVQRYGTGSVSACDRGAGREPPEACIGHVDGSYAHLAMGRALCRLHGRAYAAWEVADPDLRAESNASKDGDRFDQERSRLGERRVQDSAEGPGAGCLRVDVDDGKPTAGTEAGRDA